MDTKVENMTVSQQLQIPFEEIIENLGIPSNYDFYKLKKLYLPNNPLTDLPLFLTSKSNVVNRSRVRFKERMKGTDKSLLPNVDYSDLVYQMGSFTIKSDMDYGLPDEFDGQVFDCLLMLISKEYVEKSRVFRGYRIDETIILNEFVRTGQYKKNGALYNRIKSSLDRLYHTKYVIQEESIKKKGEINYVEILYNLVDGIYRKGKKIKNADGSVNYLDHTVVLPNSLITTAIEDKQYKIIANEKRYALSRYISKVIYDKLHIVLYAQIFSPGKEIFIAQKAGSYPYFVIGYQKFCERVGIPIKEEKNPSRVKEQLDSYVNELKEQNLIIDMEAEPSENQNTSVNLVFIFNWLFVDYVFQMANKTMDSMGINDISNDMVVSYFSKMERQIKTKKIKEKITNT